MDQFKAAQSIMECQSEDLGYEDWSCPNGDHAERLHHSCGHRSCPRCHGARTHDWLEQTKTRLLATDHYHVIFTLPHELNALWHYNRRWCGDRLFRATAETLQQLLRDERYLGAEVGLLSSLHTWGRTLVFHPHMHVLVTGGGLCGKSYRTVKQNFLLPVGVIKAKFRGKWLSGLNRAYAKGEIVLPPDWTELTWRKVLTKVARKGWNVRIQGAYRHGKGVAVYLSRYVRGGPIKDARVVHADGGEVRFRYVDHRDGVSKIMALSAEHFVTRVLWHVPVKGQHHVRYYGLYGSGAEAKRSLVREIRGESAPCRQPKEAKRRACPKCGQALRHRASACREKSYIRSATVQQGVQVDRDRALACMPRAGRDRPPGFFRPAGGHLT